MKHIEPSVRIIEQEPGIVGAKKMMEIAGRICYATQPKDGSYEKFFDDTLGRGHGRVLEFGTVYLIVPDYNNNRSIELELLKHNNYTRFNLVDGTAYITTNCRVILQGTSKNWNEAITHEYCGSIMSAIQPYVVDEPTEHHTRRVTILWDVIQRGIAAEFRTHTMVSSLMESTRYCLYTQGRFDSEVKFAISEWYRNSTNEVAKIEYLEELKHCEEQYMHFINVHGMRAEQARFVLGFNYATKFIQCAFVDTWEDFFSQRVTRRAHEDAQYIAKKALEQWESTELPKLNINYDRK